MPIPKMLDTDTPATPAPDTSTPATPDRRFGTRRRLGLAAAALLALGGAAGAVAVAESRPAVSMAPVVPVAIRSLPAGGIVTIRGRVAEIYGNKIIVADASGRALVDLGREGDDHPLVTAGEAVTVQGRFERGFVHAAFLVGADHRVTALGPLAGAPGTHGPRGPHGRPGPDGGPDAGPDGGPTAPPPAPRDAAAPGAGDDTAAAAATPLVSGAAPVAPTTR